MDGTFNLYSGNLHGCQPCFCYNKTKQCTSSGSHYEYFVQSSFLNSNDGWTVRLRNGTVASYTNTSNGIRISSSTSDTMVVIRAPSKFLGNQLSTYVQDLIAVAQITPVGGTTTPTRVNLVLNDDSGNSAIFTRIRNISGIPDRFIFQIHESQATNTLSAWQLQNILVSIQTLEIHVDMTNVSDFTLQRVNMSSMSTSRGLGAMASSFAENCSCPSNFTGLSCGTCNSGMSICHYLLFYTH